MIIDDIVKVFIPATLAFFTGILLTPAFSSFLYRNKMWKKNGGKKTMDGSATPVFDSLHKEKEVSTPKMGGVLIWLSAFLVTAILFLLDYFLSDSITAKLDFLSRNQTWIPLTTLVLGGLVGLIDDSMEIKGAGDHIAGGLSLKKRLLIVALISGAIALWFFFRLEVSSIGLFFAGEELYIGWLFIPLFVAVALGIYSGGVIDGIDGLAGGIFASIFSAYAGIALYQNQVNLASFCAVVVGAILAFLWFNIPPARFYMSETGSMALTLTLTVVAFMTDTLGGGHGLIVLPIIALPLVLTSLSDIIQIASKKIRGKKVFQIAPLHHHFEAIGWPAHKVTMRYWIIGVVSAVVGMILAFIR